MGRGHNRNNNDNNDNNNGNNDNETSENTPLLNTSKKNNWNHNRHQQRCSVETSDTAGFTAGYTDYMHSASAFKVFLFHAFVYYSIAVILFSFVLRRDWTVIDSLYYATVLFTTIGYGDLTPISDWGRICTMFLSLYGIVILGIFLGIYGEKLVANQESRDTTTAKKMKEAVVETVKMNAEKSRSMRNLAASIGSAESIQSEPPPPTPPSSVPPPPPSSTCLVLPPSVVAIPSGGCTTPEGVTFKEPDTAPATASTSDDASLGELDKEEAVQRDAERIDATMTSKTSLYSDIVRLLWSVLPVLALMLLVGIALGYFEEWDMLKSIYWTVISGTTVGLGDEAPKTQTVRLACVFFLPCCVAVLGQFLSKIAETYINRKKRKSQEEFFCRSLTLADLETMDTDKSGEVDKAEFLAFMLVALQLCSQEDIDEINKLFESLDIDHSGTLHRNDLRGMGWRASVSHALAEVALSTVLDEDDEDFRQRRARSAWEQARSIVILQNVTSIWQSQTKARHNARTQKSTPPRPMSKLKSKLSAILARARSGCNSPPVGGVARPPISPRARSEDSHSSGHFLPATLNYSNGAESV